VHGQPNTHRAYASAVDRVIALLGRDRPLADAEIGQALAELWGASAPATWNRNRAAIASWLAWCRTKKHGAVMRYIKPGAEALAAVTEHLAPSRRRH
jgi:hypothetical protein